MSKALSEKIALVTGGTRGIGKAIAQAFANAGAQVFISGRDAQTGESAAAELNASFVACDVTDAASIERMFRQIATDAGGLDILVNNAGGASGFAPVAEMSDEMWLDLLNLDLNSVFRCSRAALAMMEPRGSGRIINISSVVGTTGNPGQCNYVASKAGMSGWTKAMGMEIASRGITVNCVAPGFIATAMTDALDDGQKEKINATIPMGRMGSPEEIASAVAYLASDEAAYVTGATIHVNGGMAMV